MGEKVIHVEWDGPYSLDDLHAKKPKLSDEDTDYGVYQLYGRHVAYSGDVLLYIGKASEQTFCNRLLQEDWDEGPDAKRLAIYVGRLAGSQTPTDDQWSKEIDLCERLLIFSHTPAWNSSGLNTIPDQDLRDVHVFNWANYRDLIPEVSGARWGSKYDEMKKYDVYGKV